MLNLADLPVFLEVAQSGSLSEAARRLRMPKSSVTRHIDRLETRLGGTLFKRGARSVELTLAGRDFLPQARRLLEEGLQAESFLRGRARQATGRLTVSATGPVGRHFLVPQLGQFQARHPQLEIKLWLTPACLEVGPGEGQVDIALRLRSSAGPQVSTHKLGEIGFWIVASPAYLAARGQPLAPDDLAGHAIIELGPPGKAPHVELKRVEENIAVRYQPLLHTDDPEAACKAAEASLGIAVLPNFIAAPSVTAGRLVRVLPDWAPAPSPLNLLYRVDETPPLRVRAYVDFLLETIGQTQPWRV